MLFAVHTFDKGSVTAGATSNARVADPCLYIAVRNDRSAYFKPQVKIELCKSRRIRKSVYAKIKDFP